MANFENFGRLYSRKYKDVIHADRALTAEQLYELCVAYFQWAEKNPFNTPETANFQGRVFQGEAKKIRPFTVVSLCLFVGMATKTWREWRNGAKGADIQEVIAWAESVINEQKYSGAMAGVFNSNFVMKDLGMDVSTVKQVGDADNPIHHKVEGQTEIVLTEDAINNILSKL